jgi:hypothetical protein
MLTLGGWGSFQGINTITVCPNSPIYRISETNKMAGMLFH